MTTPFPRFKAFTLVLLAFVFAGEQLSTAEDHSRPNVLVILVDDLGYGDLSSYGAKDLESPNIDELIRRGMRMNEFYANCPVCSPTRASLLTGRYPELVGVPGVIRTHPENNWGYLDPQAVTLPQILNKSGYHTAIVGKWHLGLDKESHPNQRGFDHFHGYLGDMMDDYYKHRRHGINYMRRNETTIDPQGHATDLFTEWACDYIASRKSSADPFFLYLAYNAPHTPIQPPVDWLERVEKRQPGISKTRAKLVALIEHMDEGIGKVIATLDSTGQANNTLVIFTSDNGGQINVGANNGRLRDGKQSMYEGGLKVPFCAVWPGKIKAESISETRGATMDIFPTICEAVGVSQENSLDGVSLFQCLIGNEADVQQRDLFFHRREGGDRYGGLIINAVRRGNWKLLQNSPFAPLELYNLSIDPLEKNNLAQTNRNEFRQLSAALRHQVQRGGAVPWQKPSMKDSRK